MKSKVICVVLSLMIALSLVLASCAKPAPTTPATPTTPTPTPTVEAKWWDTFGEPQYGGTIIYRVSSLPLQLDPYSNWGGLYDYFGEYLGQWDWTLGRNTWDFSTMFCPDEYWTGRLAESWETPDAQTIIFHLRKGIQWHDKPPVSGREFTAYDVQEHYDRIMGTGKYTKPCPLYAGRLGLWKEVTATDKYTVQFKLTYPTAQGFLSIVEMAGQNWVEAPELIQQELINDWKSAVGTGPWILTDFAEGTSATFSKNPKYWGYDERHPENRLPYADEFKVVCIPDTATALAALRTGKIDIITEIGWQQAKSLTQTNPDLLQAKMPVGGPGPILRVDKEPFTDIKVRKALQLAIDRKTIAQTHYGGTVEGIPCGVVNPAHKGYAYPYEDWPQELKDEYSYNLEKARQLLAEANYPNGFKTNVVAATNADLELVQVVQAMFKDIGVDMEIKTMDPATLMGFAIQKKHDQMYWNNFPGSCGRTFIPQMNIAAFASTDMANYGNVQDSAYDAIYQKFMTTTDLQEAKRLVKEAVKYALEQHWTINICPTYTYNVYQPYLKGYSGEFIGRGALGWLFSRLWVDQDLKASMGR